MRRNVFITTDDESVLIYDTSLSDEELRAWVEHSTDMTVCDICELKQDQLQFYCIDNRIWQDDDKDAAVRKFLEPIEEYYQQK